VWLITGCSTGFGRELVRQLLGRGQHVVATARRPAALEEFALNRRAVVAELDVTVPDRITAVIGMAETRFGRIDVLVNNAGYGYLAAIEEGEEYEIRAMFETNVFGLVNMTKAVLPGMRSRRSGHIVNISSMGGLIGFPGIGYYNATKFAVEGLSEALAKEVEPLGIRVTIVEPGPFRTDWAGRSLKTPKAPIADYAETAGMVTEKPFAAELAAWREVTLGADFSAQH
jgi:NAD(P)-dependent dehydrogenase (short-subunit alcohol dehydrogenase family)